MSNESTIKFAESYDKLDKSVQAVMQCNDIDQLSSHLQAGLKAYDECVVRIDSVKSLINKMQSQDAKDQ